jgi:hypothetical protein
MINPKHKMPFYWLLSRIFPAMKSDNCFTVFGSNHYASHKEMPWYLVPHEETHVRQQKNYLGGMIWWFKYSISKKFRYEQELEAYRFQYKFICGKVKDRNKRSFYLNHMVSDLSGKMYGNLVTSEVAKEQICTTIKTNV